jgi:Kef-type K+ transport system membrane component KefB
VHNIFLELSVILIIASAVAGLMQLIKQPLIIGHIITGLLVGPYVLNLLHTNETVETFSQLGIALLIFIIGLSLNPRIIKEVGKTALITGIGQVVVTSFLGYSASRLLGFPHTAAIYVGIAISFSSTIIILKLLSDKKDLGRLYGRVAIGFLLVQDIIAMAILIGTTSLSQGTDLQALAIASLLKGTALLLSLYIVSTFILPRMVGFFAKAQEFLFIFSLSWGLGVAALFQLAGFSIEIGALFAGVALANSPFAHEIGARMRPLRDFFIVLFFIMLGSGMKLDNLTQLILPALALSAIILIGNPIIVMTLMRLLGYNKRTGFRAGMTVAQVSEFSLILVVLGNRVGHLSDEMVSLVTAVALITIAVSTYYIMYTDAIYAYLAPALSILDPKKSKKEAINKDRHDIVLFGYDHVGPEFVSSFKKLGNSFLVVDYNPEIIAQLTADGVNCRYGDADDNELLDELGLEHAKMIISTIADYDVNSLIVDHARRGNKKAVIITHSDNIEEATLLYDKGATYIMMPHYLGSTHTSSLISKHGFDLSEFTKHREKHLNYLQKRLTN